MGCFFVKVLGMGLSMNIQMIFVSRLKRQDGGTQCFYTRTLKTDVDDSFVTNVDRKLRSRLA